MVERREKAVKLLDLYLLRRFLISLCFSVLGLLLISIVVDLIERIDTFIDFSATPAQISATWSTRIAGTSGANSGTGVVIFGAERTCVSLPGTSNALTIICP